MKKILSVLIMIMIIFSLFADSLAAEYSNDLIEYLENNEVESYEEWTNVVRSINDSPLVCSYTNLLRYSSNAEEIYFNVEIDYENEMIEVDTIFVPDSQNITTAVLSTRNGSAVHETYSAAGILIYTVTVNGSFTYSANSCSTVSASGSFNRGSNSLWSSTPSITSGNISTDKAYARISGTATLLWGSSSYQLTLMCDTNGKLTTSFVRP
ncbi:MAG: hypothetical protein MJ172_09645 [Clostridia bacterium]|nr:hypothetical protein [Clostridia bacterium]